MEQDVPKDAADWNASMLVPAAEQTDLSMGRCLQRQSVPWKANQEVEEVLSGTGVRQALKQRFEQPRPPRNLSELQPTLDSRLDPYVGEDPSAGLNVLAASLATLSARQPADPTKPTMQPRQYAVSVLLGVLDYSLHGVLQIPDLDAIEGKVLAEARQPERWASSEAMFQGEFGRGLNKVLVLSFAEKLRKVQAAAK